MKTKPSEAQVLQQLPHGGFERRSVLESDDAFANDAVAVQENRGGDALDAEALLHFGRAHEQRVVDIELEKTLRGKVGKQTFPLRLGIPQKTRDSHFPTAATTTALRLHFKWRDDPPHGYILKWLDAVCPVGTAGRSPRSYWQPSCAGAGHARPWQILATEACFARTDSGQRGFNRKSYRRGKVGRDLEEVV